MMELAFECENDCKELCDKSEGCKFFKWRPSSPLKSCKLYNIEFSEHLESCNIIAWPGPWDDNGTCDLQNLGNESCGVFRKGECRVNLKTDIVKSSLYENIQWMPTEGVCTARCNVSVSTA